MAKAEPLAGRKQLLVARATLCRLRLRRDVMALRGQFTAGTAMSVAARSPAGRSTAFLLAVEILGADRAAGLLAQARRALVIARIVRVAFQWLRRPAPDAAGPPPPA
jgi:hypothetical protein